MAVDGASDLGPAFLERFDVDELLDELGGLGADNVAAQQLAVAVVAADLDEALAIAIHSADESCPVASGARGRRSNPAGRAPNVKDAGERRKRPKHRVCSGFTGLWCPDACSGGECPQRATAPPAGFPSSSKV